MALTLNHLMYNQWVSETSDSTESYNTFPLGLEQNQDKY